MSEAIIFLALGTTFAVWGTFIIAGEVVGDE